MADFPEDPLTLRLELAIRVAREAGELTLRYFQTDRFEVERKRDDSPVTIADRSAESLLRERIAAQFPDDSIVGEELGEVSGSTSYRWILDPIDGTKSFISGVPLYSQLIGVEQGGKGVVGVIFVPGLNEMVYAAKGQGAWFVRGDQPAQRTWVSQRGLDQGLFVTSQVDSFERRGAAEAFADLQRKAYITRTWGDGYGYLLVATGRAEVMVDPVMHVWDAAAIQPILEEAGGRFSDWQGEPTIFSGEGIGSNGAVHAAVLAITGRFSRPSE